MRILDVDGHMEEGVQTWQYLEREYWPRRPIPVIVPEDTIWGEWNGLWLIDTRARDFGGTPTGMIMARKKGIPVGAQELTDVPARLRAMDEAGIERQVLIPSLFMGPVAEDPDLEAALMRSYNTFVATQCNQSGGRLFYAAVVPFRRPQQAVQEIRRVKAMGSCVSIFMRGMEWDTRVDHPSHLPIFEAAEQAGLAIQVHTGRGSPTIMRMLQWGQPRPKYDFDLPPTTDGRPLIGPLLVQFAFNRIMEGGLIFEFPKLKWVFCELGSEWMVPEMTRLLRTGPTSQWGPRDYRRPFEEQRIYVTAEPDEDLPYVMRKLSEDCLVCSSDMPHHDTSRHERVEDEFRKRGDLSERQLRKILRENAARLFGWPAEDPLETNGAGGRSVGTQPQWSGVR
ncbi:MAG: amidohydrolase family protein [Chloroflexi bacterium]|nr:amidohydrolase family protein [Chloroflexota bacterium]GIW09797.1 MAG: hypothetical protein KatS3mg061_0854 [Dehalococcoidia bacterium]